MKDTYLQHGNIIQEIGGNEKGISFVNFVKHKKQNSNYYSMPPGYRQRRQPD